MRLRHLPLVLAATTTVALLPATTASATTHRAIVQGKVVDTAGHPLAGVAVSFIALDGGFSLGVAATTAADGTYRAVLSTYDDFAEVSFDGTDATGPTSVSGYVTRFLLGADGQPRVVDPSANERVTNARVVLPAGAGVSGVVTGTDGTPLAHVAVDLVTDPDVPFQDNTQAFTDGNGAWTMRGLDLGGPSSVPATVSFQAYQVTGPSPTGYAWACLGLVPIPCGGDWVGPAPQYVTVALGQMTSNTDIALPPAAVIKGRMTDTAGVGIADSAAYVYSGVHLPDGSPPGGGVGTDAHGRWTWPGLLAGTYSVCYGYDPKIVDTDAGGPTYVAECSHNSPVSKGFRGGTLFTVAAGQTINVNDSLVPNGNVTGTVVDGNGAPVYLATVKAGRVDARGQFIGPVTTGRTNRSGVYTVQGATPGTVVVCATARGYTDTCPVSSGSPTTVVVHQAKTAPAPQLVLHTAG